MLLIHSLLLVICGLLLINILPLIVGLLWLSLLAGLLWLLLVGLLLWLLFFSDLLWLLFVLRLNVLLDFHVIHRKRIARDLRYVIHNRQLVGRLLLVYTLLSIRRLLLRLLLRLLHRLLPGHIHDIVNCRFCEIEGNLAASPPSIRLIAAIFTIGEHAHFAGHIKTRDMYHRQPITRQNRIPFPVEQFNMIQVVPDSLPWQCGFSCLTSRIRTLLFNHITDTAGRAIRHYTCSCRNPDRHIIKRDCLLKRQRLWRSIVR